MKEIVSLDWTLRGVAMGSPGLSAYVYKSGRDPFVEKEGFGHQMGDDSGCLIPEAPVGTWSRAFSCVRHLGNFGNPTERNGQGQVLAVQCCSRAVWGAQDITCWSLAYTWNSFNLIREEERPIKRKEGESEGIRRLLNVHTARHSAQGRHTKH